MRRVFRLRRLEASIGRIEFCLVVILLCLGTAPAQEGQSRKSVVTPLSLPGAKGLVTLDYFAFDSANNRLWAPAGNTHGCRSGSDGEGARSAFAARTHRHTRLTDWVDASEIELK